ncbi:MAG TPA: hypothetical protein VGE31_01825 [Candidatus Paceibacterota bacterium]
MKNKHIIRPAIVTALFLMVPLVAMRFYPNDVLWTLSDFIFAGVLIFGVGLAYELMSKRTGTAAYRCAVGVMLAATFILIWMNLAVGIIGNENNPANLMYFGVVGIGVIGITLAQLKPLGMSRALFVTAVAQALVPVIALVVNRPSLDDTPGIAGVFALNTFFVVMYVVAGILFRQATVKPV